MWNCSIGFSVVWAIAAVERGGWGPKYRWTDTQFFSLFAVCPIPVRNTFCWYSFIEVSTDGFDRMSERARIYWCANSLRLLHCVDGSSKLKAANFICSIPCIRPCTHPLPVPVHRMYCSIVLVSMYVCVCASVCPCWRCFFVVVELSLFFAASTKVRSVSVNSPHHNTDSISIDHVRNEHMWSGIWCALIHKYFVFAQYWSSPE